MAGIDFSELKKAAKRITGQARRRGDHERQGLGRSQINRIKKKKIYNKGDQVALGEIMDRMDRTKRVRNIVRRAQYAEKRAEARKVSDYSQLIGYIMSTQNADMKKAHAIAKKEYGYEKVSKPRKKRKSTTTKTKKKSRVRKEGEPEKARKPRKPRKRKS